MKTRSIFEQYTDLEERLYEEVFEALGGRDPERMSNPYNTDVIVWSDGHISTNDYFGNLIYQSDDIEIVISISGNDKNNWADYWNDCMTEEQQAYCEEKGWACCFESNSTNPEDWMEYEITVSDLIELDHNVVEQAIEEYEQELR